MGRRETRWNLVSWVTTQVTSVVSKSNVAKKIKVAMNHIKSDLKSSGTDTSYLPIILLDLQIVLKWEQDYAFIISILLERSKAC